MTKYVKQIKFIIYLGYMFRPLCDHHQAFHLNHVIKTLRTQRFNYVIQNGRPDEDRIEVETCSLSI